MTKKSWRDRAPKTIKSNDRLGKPLTFSPHEGPVSWVLPTVKEVAAEAFKSHTLRFHDDDGAIACGAYADPNVREEALHLAFATLQPNVWGNEGRDTVVFLGGTGPMDVAFMKVMQLAPLKARVSWMPVEAFTKKFDLKYITRYDLPIFVVCPRAYAIEMWHLPADLDGNVIFVANGNFASCEVRSQGYTQPGGKA